VPLAVPPSTDLVWPGNSPGPYRGPTALRFSPPHHIAASRSHSCPKLHLPCPAVRSTLPYACPPCQPASQKQMKARSLLFRRRKGEDQNSGSSSTAAATMLPPRSRSVCLPSAAAATLIASHGVLGPQRPAAAATELLRGPVLQPNLLLSGIGSGGDSNISLRMPAAFAATLSSVPNSAVSALLGAGGVPGGSRARARRPSSRVLSFAASLRGAPTVGATSASGMQQQPSVMFGPARGSPAALTAATESAAWAAPPLLRQRSTLEQQPQLQQMAAALQEGVAVSGGSIGAPARWLVQQDQGGEVRWYGGTAAGRRPGAVRVEA
jgi:hypothetical protein